MKVETENWMSQKQSKEDLRARMKDDEEIAVLEGVGSGLGDYLA